MFIHREQLEYVLSPDQYRSQQQHQFEVDKLFRPGWHLAGLRSELARPGDFKTLEILDTPILLRNCDGEIRAFLNVCSHRHCLIRSEPRGHIDEIRCQYHGWEYASDGRVNKVPDGKCFKPFDRENSRLRCLRADTAGELVFVSLSESGPPLTDSLGGLAERIDREFRMPWKMCWHYERSFACNWKIPVENTVETYHLPYIHPKTLGAFGLLPEEVQSHELEDTHSTLVYGLVDSDHATRLQRRVVGILGGTRSTDEYVHYHLYPNLVFTFSDLYVYAQVYWPVTPTTCRTEAWMFSLRGSRRNPVAQVVAYLAARHGRRVNTAIQAEDASVFEAQQEGLASSPHPGCIGTREERIYAFHRYIERRTRADKGEPDGTPISEQRKPAVADDLIEDSY